MNITETMGRTKEQRAMPPRNPRYLTAKEVRQWFIDHGIPVKHWCEAHGVSLYAVNEIFRGKGRGSRGKTHEAMVKLGMKPDPKMLANPCKPQPLAMPKQDAKS